MGERKTGWLSRAEWNEAGLAVFFWLLPAVFPERAAGHGGREQGALKKLLGSCATVEEALASGTDLGGPKFLLLADASELAWVEVGDHDQVAVRRVSNGTLSHTNFYLSPEFQRLNLKKAVSARHRYRRIEGTAGKLAEPLYIGRFDPLQPG